MTYHDLFNAERPMPPGKETNMDSIPDLVARVQALEARVDAISFDSFSEDTSPAGSLATILGKRDDETIEDAARRVVAERDYASKCGAEWSSVCHEIGDAIGSQPGEKYVDAARRFVAERDSLVTSNNYLTDQMADADEVLQTKDDESTASAACRVVAERNAAVMERDEAVRMLHSLLVVSYPPGKRWVYNGQSLPVAKFLARHGLATEHEDGTFTMMEPKP